MVSQLLIELLFREAWPEHKPVAVGNACTEVLNP